MGAFTAAGVLSPVGGATLRGTSSNPPQPEELRRLRRRREGAATLEPRPEPTLEDVRREYEPSPVHQEEEVTELVGMCLWDIFSDNHDVIAADGRLADIGVVSWRGCVSGRVPHARPGGLERRRLHAVLHGERSGFPDVPT
jgi:hypothetical protein